MTDLIERAAAHLQHLCVTIEQRQTGSAGNRAATDYFAANLASHGFALETQPFDCMDWSSAGAELTVGEVAFTVTPSPYSLGCQVTAPLVVAGSLAELAAADTKGKLLLVRGELTQNQLTPKNFPYYQVDEHRQIIDRLEAGQPAAIITATGRDPELAGSLYPFPLIEDGDFHIPSVFMTDVDGERLATFARQPVTLVSRAARHPATARNVIGRTGQKAGTRVVVMAHIDAKATTPGALDNATGITTLLLLAELLAGYEATPLVEIVAINGEDYYNAPGEQTYLSSLGDTLASIQLAINIDGLGYHEGPSAYSLYEVEPQLAGTIHDTFSPFPGVVEGPLWYQGDHTIFVMSGRPALALTSSATFDLMATLIHSAQDTPDLVEPARLVETASALHALILELGKPRDNA